MTVNFWIVVGYIYSGHTSNWWPWTWGCYLWFVKTNLPNMRQAFSFLHHWTQGFVWFCLVRFGCVFVFLSFLNCTNNDFVVFSSAWCWCCDLWFWSEFSAEVCNLFCTKEDGGWHSGWSANINEWSRPWCNGNISLNKGDKFLFLVFWFFFWDAIYSAESDNEWGFEQVGMLFVRCRGGISHSPQEHVLDNDVWAAGLATLSFLENLS